MGAVKALQVFAGPRALAQLRGRGLKPADVRVIPAAAGGPKGLILNPLDRFSFGQWMTDNPRNHRSLATCVNQGEAGVARINRCRCSGVEWTGSAEIRVIVEGCTMKSIAVRAVLVVAITASLGACVVRPPMQARSPGYPAAPGAVAQVEYGVVASIEPLMAQRQTSGGGAVAGGVTGAVVGRQFGGSGEGRALGTFLGAVAGVLIGNEVERQNQGLREGVRVVVQTDSGAQRSFEFTHAGNMRIGDRVRIEGGQLVRM